MPYKHRAFDPDIYYHVISRGNNKQRLFIEPTDFERFLALTKESQDKYAISIPTFVLMPNHIHLIIGPGGAELPRFMHRIKLHYAKYYCARYGFVGHVWQGRYKALPITTDAYLHSCTDYIENNPVRAKLCELPSKWPYSSAAQKR